MVASRLLSGCSICVWATFSSNFSGFGAFDRKVLFGRIGEPWDSGKLFESDRSEGSEEVSRDLRPVLDVRRSNLAEDEVVDWRWSESLESSLKGRIVEVLRRGNRFAVLVIGASFPASSFPNLGVDDDDSKREIELLRWIMFCHALKRWNRIGVVIRS